jgi:hypothetical protein
MNLEFKIFPDQEFEGSWRVESIDEKTDAVFIAIFSGPASERLAHEYLAFKTGKHPALKPAPAPEPAPAPAPSAEKDEVLISLVDGDDMLIRPKDLLWSFSKRWNSLTGKPKPAIQRLGKPKGKEQC